MTESRDDQEIKSEKRKALRTFVILSSIICLLLGGVLVWRVDFFHLHFSYEETKAEYLSSGMPWTADDLYKLLPPAEPQNREMLIEAAKRAGEAYKLPSDLQYLDVNKASAEKLLKESEAAWRDLDVVASHSKTSLTGIYRLDDSEQIDDQLPLISRAIRLLAYRGEWRVSAGQHKEGIQDLSSAYQLAVRLSQSELMVGFMSGMQAINIIDSCLLRAASIDVLDPLILKDLEALIKASIENPVSPKNALRGEALFTLNYLRNVDVLRELWVIVSQEGFPGYSRMAGHNAGDPKTMARRSLSVRFLKIFSDLGDSIKEHPDDTEKWYRALNQARERAVQAGGMTGTLVDYVVINPEYFGAGLIAFKANRLVNISLIRSARVLAEGGSEKEMAASLESDPYTGEQLLWKRNSLGLKVWSVGANKVDDGGISKQEYMDLKSSPAVVVTGTDAYDIVASFPWKPRLRPPGSSTPPSGPFAEVR